MHYGERPSYSKRRDILLGVRIFEGSLGTALHLCRIQHTEISFQGRRGFVWGVSTDL